MRIFEFERQDGSRGFDYTVPHGARITRKIVAKSELKIKKIINNSDGRLRALAERSLLEEYLTPATEALPRTLLGRFRWLFTGK